MLVGHVAAAFVGKRLEPELSLGTLVLATMLPDILWPIFSVAGIEYVAGSPVVPENNLPDISFSHSLLMVAVWAALFTAGYFLWRRLRHQQYDARALSILFAIVLSHWMLDAVAHKHALAPGSHIYVGLMLWSSLPATLVVEGGFWLLAIILYLRATHPKTRVGVYAFWPVVALLTFIWVTNIRRGAPKPEEVIGSLVFFVILIAWAYWMNRARPVRA
ncbi:MAG TPA: hypothetical protein VF131_09170 [Blastocatellia bacterium]|nr:hypothetical protein [Blastocatellia bacterium]